MLAGLLLVDDGDWQTEGIDAALASGDLPVRDPETCVADLQAQVASNQLGVRLVEELVRNEGMECVQSYMTHVLDNGEEAVQDWLEQLGSNRHHFRDQLDDGTAVVVSPPQEEAKMTSAVTVANALTASFCQWSCGRRRVPAPPLGIASLGDFSRPTANRAVRRLISTAACSLRGSTPRGSGVTPPPSLRGAFLADSRFCRRTFHSR